VDTPEDVTSRWSSAGSGGGGGSGGSGTAIDSNGNGINGDEQARTGGGGVGQGGRKEWVLIQLDKDSIVCASFSFFLSFFCLYKDWLLMRRVDGVTFGKVSLFLEALFLRVSQRNVVSSRSFNKVRAYPKVSNVDSES